MPSNGDTPPAPETGEAPSATDPVGDMPGAVAVNAVESVKAYLRQTAKRFVEDQAAVGFSLLTQSVLTAIFVGFLLAGYRPAGPAHSLQGAQRAIRVPGHAHRGAQLHERLIEVAATLVRDQLTGCGPQAGDGCRVIDRIVLRT